MSRSGGKGCHYCGEDRPLEVYSGSRGVCLDCLPTFSAKRKEAGRATYGAVLSRAQDLAQPILKHFGGRVAHVEFDGAIWKNVT